MQKPNSLDEFAPKILNTYKRDKEEFWAAVMSPFLADSNALTMFQHRKVGMELLSLFSDVDKAAKKLLSEYTAPLGFDVTGWKSLKSKDEYFKDAYPIYAFLAIWMEEAGLTDNLKHFGDILRSVAFGIAGYGILDVIVDGSDFSPVEILTAQTLIAEYETRILKAFGVTEVNLNILHRIRDQFLKAEIKEKALRHKASPYSKENPKECGYKAAHLLTPFMMSLERLGKADLIDAYFDVFFNFGAVIQILDDIKDLEDDLAIGHFSYITLETEVVEQINRGRKPRDAAKMLLGDKQKLNAIYHLCKNLINESNILLEKLNDPLLARIVHVTALRLDSFFRKELKL